jgi:hypothetical protein
MTNPTPFQQVPTPHHLGETGAIQRYRDERDALRNRLAAARRELAELAGEVRRLRIVEEKAQAYVMAGLCGNPDTRAELTELIKAARTDR